MRQPKEIDHDTAIADVARTFNGISVGRKRKRRPKVHVPLALAKVIADVTAKGGKFLSVKSKEDNNTVVTYTINRELFIVSIKDD